MDHAPLQKYSIREFANEIILDQGMRFLEQGEAVLPADQGALLTVAAANIPNGIDPDGKNTQRKEPHKSQRFHDDCDSSMNPNLAHKSKGPT